MRVGDREAIGTERDQTRRHAGAEVPLVTTNLSCGPDSVVVSHSGGVCERKDHRTRIGGHIDGVAALIEASKRISLIVEAGLVDGFGDESRVDSAGLAGATQTLEAVCGPGDVLGAVVVEIVLSRTLVLDGHRDGAHHVHVRCLILFLSGEGRGDSRDCVFNTLHTVKISLLLL